MASVDIVIVGGGLIGLIVAHLALRENFTVAMIDLEKPRMSWTDDYGLRVSAVNQKTISCFKEIGVWEDIMSERVSSYQKMHVWDALSSGAIDFDAEDVGETVLGYIIENRVMIKVLASRLAPYQKGGQLLTYFGDCVDTLRRSKEWNIQLRSGLFLESSILIAADGAESALREQLGFKMTQMHYGQHAVVATIEIEKSHEQTAYQVFLPAGPLALLPLTNPHRCSIVWSTDPREANTLVDCAVTDFNQAIQEAFGLRLGVIQVCSARLHFPLISRHAEEYVAEGVALVGDAAHTIHPLAGQGMNLGVQDAHSLVDTLSWAHALERPLDSLATLKRYERDRMGQNQLMLWAMQGFNGLFSNDSPVLSKIRGFSLNQVNNFPLVKETFIQIASGQDTLNL